MIKADPHGGYITSWIVADQATGESREIFYQGSSIKRTGIPPLFPCWGDSGTALRKHGFARDVLWRVAEQDNDHVIMEIDSRDLKAIIKKEYPYDFKTRITARSDGNRLDYSMEVFNESEVGLPIAPAIHPYFAIAHEDKKKIMTEGILGFQTMDFDWDKTPPDNDYPFPGSAKIDFPGRTIEIADTSPNSVFKRMVVWSQPTSSPDFNFVCFEPITALAGAIKRKDIVVEPKSSWEMRLSFTVLFR